LIEEYLDGMSSGDASAGLNVPVKGEFGSGKTHLVGYTAHSLWSGAVERGLVPSVATASAMETTPQAWYCAVIGPGLAALDLERMAVELFAQAAKDVAGRAPLTAVAVRELESNPETVRMLVQSGLLNSTAVEAEFMDRLESLLADTDDDVRRAIAGLVWTPRPSSRWLAGEAISEREQAATGLPAALATDELAADVLVAVATLHARLRRPFLLIVDELEHFIRVDDNSGGKTNVTWLKRLLERLRPAGAMVLVAGHLSAWEGKRDYLDRFSPNATIELDPLSADEVMEILERHAGLRRQFTPENAARVAEVAAGNIRFVLTILHDLYGRTDGFAVPVSDSTIAEVAAEAGRRVDPEQAIASLVSLLSESGFRAARNAVASGIPFDLVAYRGENLAAVMEIKHSVFGVKQQEQAQRFIDKIRVLGPDAEACAGVFLSEGGLDQALDDLDSSAARILWFDVTSPDFLENVRSSLLPVLESAANASSDGAEAAQRGDALSRLVLEIQSVKDAQAEMYDRLGDRLNAAGDQVTNLEFQSPARDDTNDIRRTLYEDFSRTPSRAHRIGLMFTSRMLLVLIPFTLGGCLLALADALARSFAVSEVSYGAYRVIFFVMGAMGMVSVLVVLARSYLVVDRFYVFKQERLRDVYVLDLPVQALADTNAILEEGLARHGPRDARSWITEELGNRGLLIRFDKEEQDGHGQPWRPRLSE